MFGLLTGLMSCSDFLELEPESQSVAIGNTSADSVYFHSGNEVEAALAAAYGDFKNEYYQLDYFVNGDAQSDDAYAGDNPANFQIDDYNIDATNSNVSRDWRYLYSTIGKTNTIINNLEGTIPGLTEERKTNHRRSFLYQGIYVFPGGAIMGRCAASAYRSKKYFSSGIGQNLFHHFPARSTQDEVYNQIIKDFETALANVNATAIHKGIATKGAVNAMLAKVYATRPAKDWNKVLSYCNDVIAGGYTLLPNYDDLWNNSAENTSESIFEINYNGGASDGNWGVKIFRGLDWKNSTFLLTILSRLLKLKVIWFVKMLPLHFWM